MATNEQAYRKDDVINIYTGKPKLFGAEAGLIRKYKEQLGKAQFLDIGIGGGRTTYFIAPLVQKYDGVDYSERFVSYVASRFKDHQNVNIQWGDARDLSSYQDLSFDFVLFSFNGIDCVGPDDRRKILSECFRVLKPSGHLWFSFHNIHSLSRLYSFQWPRNPFRWLGEWKRSRKVKQINGELDRYAGREYCILRDGADFFETEVMYILPATQLKMLKEEGFAEIRYYDARCAKLLSLQNTDSEELDWIYVDCLKDYSNGNN